MIHTHETYYDKKDVIHTWYTSIELAIYNEHNQRRFSAEIHYTIPVTAKITGEIQLALGNCVPRPATCSRATYNRGNRNRL